MKMGPQIKNPQHQQRDLNWQSLLQRLVGCCYKACKVIHQSSLKKVGIKYKIQCDPVTQIDHTIQKLIATELAEAQFEGVNFVGEQHIDEVMIDNEILTSVNAQEVNQRLFEQQLIFPTLNQMDKSQEKVLNKDVCIFVDPLDCTRGYICGKLWECTVLIGVTVKGRPVLGIIGQPFKRGNNKEPLYEPRIIVGGTILSQKVYYEFADNAWKKIQRISKPDKESPTFAVSSRRCSQKQQHLIASLRANKIHCGGSGNKLAMVIRGEVDAVCFVECPLSTWDSCAGEAIILGLKGILTKPNSSRIQYNQDNEDQTIYCGYICCLDLGLHEKIVQCLKIQHQHHHH